MVLRRKQARGRPPKDSSSSSPPPRRAKAVANANIAAIMMDTDGPSAKIPKLELNDKSHGPNSRSAPKLKEEIDSNATGQSSETCAVCLGQKVDPTELDNCVHSFCYTCTSQWFKYSEKCPLCMTLTKTFYHNLKAPNGKEAVSVSELHTIAEAARLAERGQSQPPLDEHECIRLRIRRLQRRLSVLQAEMNRNTRDDRKLEFNTANSRLVNEISRLEMLRRDATNRADLVSNVVFRSLIYKDNLDWSSIDRNANRVPFSPAVFREHIAESTDRIRAFLDRELPIVWRSRRPRESREQYFKHRDVVLSDIVSWCGEYQINSPQFSRNLRTAGIYPQYLQRFQSELFEFASSMLTLRNFDSTSTYSSAEVRRMLERRNRRAGNSQEVVTVSDSDDTDSAVIPLDNVRGRTGHRRRDDEIIVLSDDNLSDQDAHLRRGESNYVRDEATSSNSETSNGGDFYTRPACLLPQNQLYNGNPIRVIDAFGVLRNIYTPRPLFDASLDSMANDLPVMFPRMNLRDHQYFRNSRSSSPVEVVDNTIVLSSEDEGSDRVQRKSRRRLKNSHANRDRNEASSFSHDAIAANGISWLNPTNAGVHPTAFVPYSSSSSSSVQSSTPQNGFVEPRPLDSYVEPSLSRYGTPSYSPRPLNDTPSTSKQDFHVTPSDSGNSQEPNYDQKRPKSLFQPSPAKIYTPIEGTEVRAENKLLAKLFQERQLRNSLRKDSDSVQETSRDEMDVSSMSDSIFADTASTSNAEQFQYESNKGFTVQPDASGRDAAEVSKLEPSGECSSLQSVVGENFEAPHREVRPSSSSAAAERRKHTSWSYLFRKFRRKMRHEKNREKQDRLYEFIVDMKKELDKELLARNHVKREDEDHDRNRDHSRHSSANRRDTTSRRSRSRNHSERSRRRSRSSSHSHSESRKEGRDEYENDDRCTRRTRSRSRSSCSGSSERHRSREYSKGLRSRFSSSTSAASRSWTDRGSSLSDHYKNASRHSSYSSERSRKRSFSSKNSYYGE